MKRQGPRGSTKQGMAQRAASESGNSRRACGSNAVYIALALPPADQPSSLFSMHASSAASVFFSTSMASLTSIDDSEGKVSFLRHPPPPFDIDFVGCERQSDYTDEEWLPDVKGCDLRQLQRLDRFDR